MDNSELTPWRAWRAIGLSLLFFLLLDAALFRSRLYTVALRPFSVVGGFDKAVQAERQQATNPRRDVLFLGNSKIKAGISFDQLNARQLDVRFLDGATFGSELKWWYYQLAYVDPSHDRYRAIVIPVNGYLARPDSAVLGLYSDRASAAALFPFIGYRDWPAFLDSFHDPDSRAYARSIGIFPSRLGSVVVSDGLERIKDWFRALGHHDSAPAGADPAVDADITQLRYDYAGGKVDAWPAQFDRFRQTITERHMKPPSDPAQATRASLAYSSQWLNRIIAAYRGSPTTIIIAPIPAYGVPMRGSVPIQGAPDIRHYLRLNPHVVLVSDAYIPAMSRKDLFVDVLHLNSAGQKALTAELRTQITRALQASAPPRP